MTKTTINIWWKKPFSFSQSNPHFAGIMFWASYCTFYDC